MDRVTMRAIVCRAAKLPTLCALGSVGRAAVGVICASDGTACLVWVVNPQRT